MPIYDYACDKCGHEFHVEQRITEDPVKSCPSCRSRQVKRLISQTSFVLKGGGWYSDLYASPGKKDDKSDKTGGDDASAKSGGKSKDKSDSKKSSKKDSGKGGSGGKGAKAAA